MEKKPNIDLSANHKQAEYFYEVLKSCNGLNALKYFGYGGAIRGGKTFITLFILAYLCKRYPGSRWHVIRKDLTVLKATTIPSFQKLISGSPDWRYIAASGSPYFIHKNGSQIIFKSQNISEDPLLEKFLGLETNGLFLEQAEELSEKLWEKALERTGSWYLDKMPPAFVFLTFNPTQNWTKTKFHEPFIKSELQPPYYYQTALPKDNPFVTADQWSNWGQMAERYRLKFVEGDWTDFGDTNNLFAFAFDSKKHIGRPELDRRHPVYLSFDFNRNPIACSIIQHIDKQVRVLECIKLANSDIYALCKYIQVHYPGCLFMVTGDATGKNSSALVRDNLNYYIVIKAQLKLSSGQMKQPLSNPKIVDNQVLVNSILANYSVIIHEEKAKSLIFDFRNVKTTPDGDIDKTNRQDESQQADALDTFRYWCNTFMNTFLKTIGS